MTKLPHNKFIILGSGTSQGVPVIGCNCKVCASDNPKDTRLRSSAFVEFKGKKILIDIGPDFRQQMLKYGITDIDKVLITHEHNDHVNGLDDIRPINFRHNKVIPLYGQDRVVKDIRTRFAYAFDENPYPGAPRIETNCIEAGSSLVLGDNSKVDIISVWHGTLEVFAYRFDDVAYVCDVSMISPESMEKLKNLSVIIMSALHHRSHPAHFTLAQAIEILQELKPKQAYITHMSHEMGMYDDVQKMLPDFIAPAYDGLEIYF